MTECFHGLTWNLITHKSQESNQGRNKTKKTKRNPKTLIRRNSKFLPHLQFPKSNGLCPGGTWWVTSHHLSASNSIPSTLEKRRKPRAWIHQKEQGPTSGKILWAPGQVTEVTWHRKWRGLGHTNNTSSTAGRGKGFIQQLLWHWEACQHQ